MKQNISSWGRRSGLLARAVLLSLAAGFLAGTAQAADFTKPITGGNRFRLCRGKIGTHLYFYRG